MEQFKRAKVIMLPHNNINTIITKYLPNTLSLNNDLLQPHTNQHLYIISDDEIKKGDLHITSDHEGYGDKKYKIIATTDTSLNGGMQNGKIYNHNFIGTKYEPLIIPQPSQQFIKKYIEEYNKGNIITDVLVEYELLGHEEIPSELWEERYKVNPKDNTITIKKVKDSWNREEVINKLYLMSEFMKNKTSLSESSFNKWIEENL